jgi:hypothetical protein
MKTDGVAFKKMVLYLGMIAAFLYIFSNMFSGMKMSFTV